VLYGGREFLVHPLELFGRKPISSPGRGMSVQSFDHFGGAELLRTVGATETIEEKKS